MTTIRKRMKVAEGYELWEIAPKFDWKILEKTLCQVPSLRWGNL